MAEYQVNRRYCPNSLLEHKGTNCCTAIQLPVSRQGWSLIPKESGLPDPIHLWPHPNVSSLTLRAQCGKKEVRSRKPKAGGLSSQYRFSYTSRQASTPVTQEIADFSWIHCSPGSCLFQPPAEGKEAMKTPRVRVCPSSPDSWEYDEIHELAFTSKMYATCPTMQHREFMPWDLLSCGTLVTKFPWLGSKVSYQTVLCSKKY